jgi:hypothetical protein
MSALPSEADMLPDPRHVRLVPKADIRRVVTSTTTPAERPADLGRTTYHYRYLSIFRDRYTRRRPRSSSRSIASKAPTSEIVFRRSFPLDLHRAPADVPHLQRSGIFPGWPVSIFRDCRRQLPLTEHADIPSHFQRLASGRNRKRAHRKIALTTSSPRIGAHRRPRSVSCRQRRRSRQSFRNILGL